MPTKKQENPEELRKLMGKRIKQVREENKLNGTEFGEIFERSKIWTHSVESGRTELSMEQIRLMKQRLNVKYNFLLDGEESGGMEAELERVRKENEELKRRVEMMEDYVRLLKQSNKVSKSN